MGVNWPLVDCYIESAIDDIKIIHLGYVAGVVRLSDIVRLLGLGVLGPL